MKRMRAVLTRRSGNWYEFVSHDPAEIDILRLILGVRGDKFIKSHAGHEVTVAHGPVVRFATALGSGMISNVEALRELVPTYSQKICRVVYDRKGILGYKTMRKEDWTEIEKQTESCFFFYDYDGHFRGPRLLLESLCEAFRYVRRGANCRGSFHTAGAVVARHCDETDVLTLQLFGTRRWRIERNANPPIGIHDPVRLPRKNRDGWDERFGPSGRVITLRPGSALYVPSGWWHETRSTTISFAITVGLVPKGRAG